MTQPQPATTISVLYFASLREAIERDSESVPITAPITALQLVAHLKSTSPKHRQALHDTSSLRVAINQKLADFDATINAGDEVALFPPVTGG